jgi:hypothetical protein
MSSETISDQQLAVKVYAAVLDCHEESLGQAQAVVVKEYTKGWYQGDSDSEQVSEFLIV